VTEVYTYADQHPGTVEHASKLRSELRDHLKEYYQLTGVPIHTAYAPAQISRLAKEEPVGLMLGNPCLFDQAMARELKPLLIF